MPYLGGLVFLWMLFLLVTVLYVKLAPRKYKALRERYPLLANILNEIVFLPLFVVILFGLRGFLIGKVGDSGVLLTLINIVLLLVLVVCAFVASDILDVGVDRALAERGRRERAAQKHSN